MRAKEENKAKNKAETKNVVNDVEGHGEETRTVTGNIFVVGRKTNELHKEVKRRRGEDKEEEEEGKLDLEKAFRSDRERERFSSWHALQADKTKALSALTTSSSTSTSGERKTLRRENNGKLELWRVLGRRRKRSAI